jgi:hypothetical protein
VLAPELLGKPKIDYLRNSLLEDDVCRLDISMDDLRSLGMGTFCECKYEMALANPLNHVIAVASSVLPFSTNILSRVGPSQYSETK